MIKHSEKDISAYAKIRDLKFFLLFIFDFPFSIPLPPLFEMTINSILCEPFQDKRKRYFTVCSEYYWSESIDIPGREVVSATIIPDLLDESVKYKQQSTRAKLIVQIYDDEIEKVKELLKESSFRSVLLIRLLSILEIKLVEVKGFSFGSEYINYGADRVLLFRYDDNVDRIKMIQSLITCNYMIDWSHSILVGSNDYLGSDDVCMWRYYANRCEIAYNRKQNSDCVLYAAISIESYIHQLMLDNKLLDCFDTIKNNDSKMLKKYKDGEISVDEFLKSINEGSNYSDSVFGVVDFLFEKNVINDTTRKSIKKSFGTINKTRNAIVHGDMDTVLVNDAIAKKAYESMVAVFSQIAFTNPPRIQPNFHMVSKEMAEISNKRNHGDDSTELEFQRFIDNNLFYSFSCFNLGLINFRKRLFDRSKEFFLICIERKRYMIESYYYLARIAYYNNDYELMNKYKNSGLSLVSMTNIHEEFKGHDFEVISNYVSALNNL